MHLHDVRRSYLTTLWSLQCLSRFRLLRSKLWSLMLQIPQRLTLSCWLGAHNHAQTTCLSVLQGFPLKNGLSGCIAIPGDAPKSMHIPLAKHLTYRLKTDCSLPCEWDHIQKYYNSSFHLWHFVLDYFSFIYQMIVQQFFPSSPPTMHKPYSFSIQLKQKMCSS